MRARLKATPIGVRATLGVIVALGCAAWIIAPLAAERTNHPPTLQGLFPAVRGAENTAGAHLSLSVFATDPDGDPITVTFTGPVESQT
ncbi:MAG TPA: hypothetical protein VEL79_09195, partial [Vicinamibacterales bacterium]|nr:hypothetical protein [Vicinamibacterales bacterium]